VLQRSTIGRALATYRGGRRQDLAAVATLAGILANALNAGDFEFIELNPVIVAEQGASVVDI
jgi:succinyl-CoA synthetase beta subunit